MNALALGMFAALNLFPHPFITDGCTSFPNGTLRSPELWLHCCVEHDLFLWAGGTRKMRNRADIQLRDCVRETGALREADVMYLGVRMGCYFPVKIPHMSWANAWDGPSYIRLTREQIDAIKLDLPRYDLPFELERKLIDSLEAEAPYELSP
ncbi:MAG: hypothetical protein H7301_13565 [Cryobacterium sp.]|nr:hypothetical protein [Oligoflexia bacterium]